MDYRSARHQIQICSDLLGHAVGDDYPYSREINLQVVLSGAVLTIEDPGEARDDVAVYTAGVEGLACVRGADEVEAEADVAALDDLIEKRDRGELVDQIARLANEKCRSRKRSGSPLRSAQRWAWCWRCSLPIGLGEAEPPSDGEHTPENITTRTARIFRRVVLICAAYYATVGIALHFLEPEYDPRFHFMSDYAWGAYGWLMTTTFFVLGLAALTVAVGVPKCAPLIAERTNRIRASGHRGTVRVPSRRI